MTTGSEHKLKILCIHGYRQNGNVFKTKLGAFRKIVNKHADLTFITADHAVVQKSTDSNGPTAAEEDPSDPSAYGWWFSKPDDSFNAHDGDLCTGFDRSVQTVKTAITEQGPFDGVLGFSQGAAFAALLLALQQPGKESLGFKFAILIAGFKSRATQHSQLREQTIDCPSLHVFGDTDRIIPKELSEELVLQFQSPEILSHSGGHFTPATSGQKRHYLEFLDKMLNRAIDRSIDTELTSKDR